MGPLVPYSPKDPSPPMPLETATHVSDLVASNPASSDGLSQADDHIRMIKQVLLTDIGDALHSESLSVVDGSSSVPSIGFQADNTAGFYRKGTGNTGIVGRLTGQGAVPIGALITHAASVAPTGYLACNGAAVSRTTYADLFTVIGTTWGAGDGSTTFNLPSLSDRFMRNTGTAAGAVGTLQADQNKAHTHTFSATTGNQSASHTHGFTPSGTISNGAISVSSNGAGANIGGSGNDGGLGIPSSGQPISASQGTSTFSGSAGTTGTESTNHTHSVSGTTAGGSADGTEARPLSATVLVCIRAL